MLNCLLDTCASSALGVLDDNCAIHISLLTYLLTYKLTVESSGERRLKIDQRLAKLQAEV